MGLTCLQNNNTQQTSFPMELEPICHREPYFGPICLGQQCFFQGLGPICLGEPCFGPICLGQQCFPQGLGPICPKKVATPHSPQGSWRNFPFSLEKLQVFLFLKKLAYEVAQRLHFFFSFENENLKGPTLTIEP